MTTKTITKTPPLIDTKKLTNNFDRTRYWASRLGFQFYSINVRENNCILQGWYSEELAKEAIKKGFTSIGEKEWGYPAFVWENIIIVLTPYK